MKLEYTQPELEITLFATEAIMADSAVGGDEPIEIVDAAPAAFDYSNFE